MAPSSLRCPTAHRVPYRGTCTCGRYDRDNCENCLGLNYCRSLAKDCRTALRHLLYAACWAKVPSLLVCALEHDNPDAWLRDRWVTANRSDMWDWTAFLAMYGVIPALAETYNEDGRIRRKMTTEELRAQWTPCWADVEALWAAKAYVLPP
jgi:hypothetical protein